ncbi:hypothetical protein HYDPIDRAFT_114732 [Hydnomerulius pinastri MD-312]|uniref:Uncharacterized protein n=1 Tax=Hydnomerulius pinastri MD-312 TaxID=994086 RepID=A0A0C9WCL2_9AGAM|nr:hypothetical protein HYDPIDRAFT_114732 [Hydnomerulius pinastri MD-312]
MSTSGVHPSAVGRDTQPERRASSTQGDGYSEDPSLPPQRLAGAAGLGPNYGKDAGFGDKIGGLTEEIKGKILRKPEVTEHGHDRRTGQLKRKEEENVGA